MCAHTLNSVSLLAHSRLIDCFAHTQKREGEKEKRTWNSTEQQVSLRK
jgi:hypothetical protein